MSVITLPTSMNLSEVKPSCVADMKGGLQRFRSDNSTYGAGDIIRIEIPCGRAGHWLHAQDSFIEGKFKLDYTYTGGTLAIDGNALSLFKSVRILHGSNVLVNVQNANRLYHAIYDIQVSSAERNAGQITMCIATEATTSPHNNLFGQPLAQSGVGAQTIPFAFTIPCSILGSLQEKAIPLGWCGASSLYLELELDAVNRIFTGRTDSNVIIGAKSAATAAPVYNSFVVSDIYYNAKISQLGLEYDNALRNALGNNILIPATEYKTEQKAISATSASFSDKFSYNMSSAKFFLWWITAQSTANGVLDGFALNSALTQRGCGVCKDYCLTFNGEMFPSQPISMSINGITYQTKIQHGAVAYQNLLRCFNQNSDTNAGGVMDLAIYGFSDTDVTSDGTQIKRFVGGIDLDRSDGNNSRSMAGYNTMNQNVMLNVNWDTGVLVSQNLYSAVCYDVAYQLQDGLLSVRM